jgi:hypothetical protein
MASLDVCGIAPGAKQATPSAGLRPGGQET